MCTTLCPRLMALHSSFHPACSYPACILSSTDPSVSAAPQKSWLLGWLCTLGLQLQWPEPGSLRTLQSTSHWGPGAPTQLNLVQVFLLHPGLQAEAGVGAIKHNNVHSVEMLTAGKGGQLSKSALLCGLACALLCCLPPAEHRQLRGRFNSSRGGHSDSALCKFSCELLPQVSLFCESEELVQLCFLNHLISTLRPTPRWGRPLHLLAKRLGLQAGCWPVVSVCAIY